MIFQVGITEISSFNLDNRALGKFSFLVDGKPHGFYRTRSVAEGAFGKQLTYEWQMRSGRETSHRY